MEIKFKCLEREKDRENYYKYRNVEILATCLEGNFPNKLPMNAFNF